MAFIKVSVMDSIEEKARARAESEELHLTDALRPYINAWARGELSMKPVWNTEKGTEKKNGGEKKEE